MATPAVVTQSMTLPIPLPPPPPPPLLNRQSGLRKAAVLILSVEMDTARLLMQSLRDADVQRLTDEIARISVVPTEEQAQVLLEFYGLLETQQMMLQGGPDYAERLLVESFGRERADEMMSQIRQLREHSHSDLAALQKMDPAQLSKFLDGEHPQTVALVLAHLNPKRGSSVLMQLKEDLRVEAVRRLAEMRQFSPEMAQKVALILYRRIEALGANGRQSYAGFKAVADLLNRLDSSASRSILEEIEQREPKLAIGIRNLMFTFEDLLTIPQEGIREIVSSVDKKTLAMSLKNADDNLCSYFFQTMSSRAIEMLKEDMDSLGPVRGREIAKARQDILALARSLEQGGRLTLKMETENDVDF